jgi:hypothetical protein
MDLQIQATLWAPRDHLYIGGGHKSNKAVFTIDTKVPFSWEIFDQVLDDNREFFLRGGIFSIKGLEYTHPTKDTRLLIITGYMKSADRRYMEQLVRGGWSLDNVAASHHGLPTNITLRK